jgi:U4/U6.U5 tri-snRNP component SNU23
MSTNLNYKQVANVTRRTWDADAYEKKARARQEAAEGASSISTTGGRKKRDLTNDHDDPEPASSGPSKPEEDEKEEFVPAERGAVGPDGSDRAYLKARKARVDLDSKVGTSEIISAEAAATTRLYGEDADPSKGAGDGVVKTGVGWHCKVCDCFLKDSHTYLDHINGRKHQRKLGYSMRVERSSKDQLLSKLEELSKKKELDQQRSGSGATILDYRELVQSKDEEERRRKEERRQKRLDRKKRLAEQEEQRQNESEDNGNDEDRNENGEEAEDEDAEPQVDPALAAMMGFSGFGGKR